MANTLKFPFSRLLFYIVPDWVLQTLFYGNLLEVLHFHSSVSHFDLFSNVSCSFTERCFQIKLNLCMATHASWRWPTEIINPRQCLYIFYLHFTIFACEKSSSQQSDIGQVQNPRFSSFHSRFLFRRWMQHCSTSSCDGNIGLYVHRNH